MKKTLLFIILMAGTTFFAQTNLVLNGNADGHTSSTSDSVSSNSSICVHSSSRSYVVDVPWIMCLM
jgi:hypothetical protein